MAVRSVLCKWSVACLAVLVYLMLKDRTLCSFVHSYQVNSVCVDGVRRLSLTKLLAVTNSKVQFDPNEPDSPSVKTAVPGPKSLQRLADLSRIQVNAFGLMSINFNKLFAFSAVNTHMFANINISVNHNLLPTCYNFCFFFK